LLSVSSHIRVYIYIYIYIYIFCFLYGPCRIKESRLFVLPRTSSCYILLSLDGQEYFSQYSGGLRRSSPARTLGSWVRIPLEAWMSVCVYSVSVLFCM
jgi:hypothetical protein